MRLLVHGMQSSGATAFTRVLAERPGSVALVDIPNNFAAPRVRTKADFVAKCVVTTAYPFDIHVERFRPDRTVLLLRNPLDNYLSLRTKPYRNHSGWMEEKFLILDRLFAERDRFDAVIRYEDFVARDPSVFQVMAGLGWPLEPRYFDFTRSYDELLKTLWAHEPHLMGEMDVTFGNVQRRSIADAYGGGARTEGEVRLVECLCPRLSAYYRSGHSDVT